MPREVLASHALDVVGISLALVDGLSVEVDDTVGLGVFDAEDLCHPTAGVKLMPLWRPPVRLGHSPALSGVCFPCFLP